MRGFMKRTLSLALSLGLVFGAAFSQTDVAHAATDTESFDFDQEKYSSTFTFAAEDLSQIEYALNNEKNNVEVTIHIPATSEKVLAMSTIKVPKSTIQAVQKSGRTAEFIVASDDSGMEYAWKFSGASMDKLADINIATKITPVADLKLTDAITVNSAAIQLKQTGDLPKNTRLIIPIDEEIVLYDMDYARENSYYLYKVNSSKLAYVTGSRYKLDKEDCFSVPIPTGGTYVLTPTNLRLGQEGGSTPSSVQLQSYSGSVVSGGVATLLITSPASTTFSVTSANPAVAQVLGGAVVTGGTQYRVQGLSAGTSVITVTAPGIGSTSYTLTVTQPTGWVMIDTLSYNLAPGNIYDYKVTLSGATADQVTTSSSRPHIASVQELRRVARSDGNVDVYYRIKGIRASQDPVTVSSAVRGTHSSIRVMVTDGIKQHGTAARNTSYFAS